jgi:type IV pilus assembly protein PilA
MKAPKIVKKAQAGFTLIELMIVVAIIGILAAVAIPAYQDYVAKSKFAAALGEVSAGKTAFEVKLNEGVTPATAADVGLSGTATANCETFTVTGTTLTCKITGGPSTVSGQNIVLTRDGDGGWTCAASTIKQKLIGPSGVCVGTAS